MHTQNALYFRLIVASKNPLVSILPVKAQYTAIFELIYELWKQTNGIFNSLENSFHFSRIISHPHIPSMLWQRFLHDTERNSLPFKTYEASCFIYANGALNSLTQGFSLYFHEYTFMAIRCMLVSFSQE